REPSTARDCAAVLQGAAGGGQARTAKSSLPETAKPIAPSCQQRCSNPPQETPQRPTTPLSGFHASMEAPALVPSVQPRRSQTGTQKTPSQLRTEHGQSPAIRPYSSAPLKTDAPVARILLSNFLLLAFFA